MRDDPSSVDPEAVEWLHGTLAKLEWKPGDVFVLMYEAVLSGYEERELRNRWEVAMPGTTLLVLERGLKLGVLSESES